MRRSVSSIGAAVRVRGEDAGQGDTQPTAPSHTPQTDRRKKEIQEPGRKVLDSAKQNQTTKRRFLRLMGCRSAAAGSTLRSLYMLNACDKHPARCHFFCAQWKRRT